MSTKQTPAGDYLMGITTTNVTGNWVVNPNSTTGMPFPNITTGPFAWKAPPSTTLEVDGISVSEALQDLMAQVNILAGEVMKLRKELRGFKLRNSRNRRVGKKGV